MYISIMVGESLWSQTHYHYDTLTSSVGRNNLHTHTHILGSVNVCLSVSAGRLFFETPAKTSLKAPTNQRRCSLKPAFQSSLAIPPNCQQVGRFLGRLPWTWTCHWHLEASLLPPYVWVVGNRSMSPIDPPSQIIKCCGRFTFFVMTHIVFRWHVSIVKDAYACCHF